MKNKLNLLNEYFNDENVIELLGSTGREELDSSSDSDGIDLKGGYSISHYGIYDEAGNRISETPLIPSKILKDNQGFYVELTFYSYFEHLLNTLVLPYSDVRAHKKLEKIAVKGVDIDADNSKNVAKYIVATLRNYRSEIPVVNVTQCCGWHGENFVPYSSLFEITEKPKAIISESIASKGSISSWLEAFSLIESSLEVRVVLAGSCLAPLLKKLHFSENPIINLVGATANGKTIALKFAASIWGNPESCAFFRCANATNMNIEAAAKIFCDLPVFLDEAETAEWSSKELMRWAQGIERGRYGSVDVTKYQNTFLLTSEKSILPSQFNRGLLNRLFEISMDSELGSVISVNEFSKIYQNNFGTVGMAYTNEIKDLDSEGQLDEIFSRYCTAVKEYANENRITLSEKIIRMIGALLTADFILLSVLNRFGNKYNAIKIGDIVQCYIDGNSEDPEENAFYHLCLECNKKMVKGKNNLKPDSVGFLDPERNVVYVERVVAERYRNYFVNWNASGKTAKYNNGFYKPVLGRQFITITDSDAIEYFKNMVC